MLPFNARTANAMTRREWGIGRLMMAILKNTVCYIHYQKINKKLTVMLPFLQ
jgi:hypothetical protein